MRQTRILTLVLAAIVSAVGAYSIVKIAVSSGLQVPVSQWSLILTLVVIGTVVLILAIPMIRYRRALQSLVTAKSTAKPKRVDPFYAYRLLLLAKATAISGTLFLGWHFGILAYQFAAPVLAGALLPRSISGCAASVFMAVAGLIVERICKLPDADNTADGDATAKKPGAVKGTEGAAA